MEVYRDGNTVVKVLHIHTYEHLIRDISGVGKGGCDGQKSLLLGCISTTLLFGPLVSDHGPPLA